MKLIDKSKLLEGLKKLKQNLSASPIVVIEDVESLVESLEVEEVDLEKEYKEFVDCDNGRSMFETAKHFFELGLKVNYPITSSDKGMAEEIIINLKRVEKDYQIDLTKEIEWLRNKTKKGE